MKIEALIKECQDEGTLTSAQVEKIEEFIEGVKVSPELKDCDIEFLAFMMLFYGYGWRLQIDKEDVKRAIKSLRHIDQRTFEYFVGMERGLIVEGLEKMLSVEETIIAGPISDITGRPVGKKGGAREKQEIRLFINVLCSYFKDIFEKSSLDKVLEVLGYFEPWTRGEKEGNELNRLKRYRDEPLEINYYFLETVYKEFKSY